MFPVIRVIFAVLGAFLGAALARHGGWVFAAIVGAFISFAIAELRVVRSRILSLEAEVAKLRANLGRLAAEAPARAESAQPALATSSTAVAPIPSAPPAPPAAPAPLATHESSLAALDELRREERISAALSAQQGDAARPGEAARRGDSDMPILNAVREFFAGGNALVRAGIIVLFFGVAFLLRYVAEHTRVPIELRLAGVAAAAIAMLVLGWTLRKARPGYALALQGGAVGILNLIIFAALHLYALLPPAAAFAVLAILAALSAVLALLQNSMAFALLAVTGGFLAPILASTGNGNHVVLFSYYAILNAAIVAIAWFKAWRPLNLAGFAFTFIIGTLWGVLRYRAEDFSTTEPFLVLFFLFYVAVAVLFTLRQPANLRGYVDATLVFGLPIVAFGLQSTMLHARPLSLAYSAVAVSALYLLIAWLLHRARAQAHRVLIEAFVALGVAFLTLAVPLALDSRWNAATWGLEGGALIWIGCRQYRRLPRAFGALLIVAAGCVLAQDFEFIFGQLVLKPGAYLGVLTLSAVSVFSANTLYAHRQRLARYEDLFAAGLFLWGVFWWSVGGLGEIAQYVPHPYVAAAVLIFAALTALLSSESYRHTQLGIAKVTALLLLPAMALCAAGAVDNVPQPFAHGGWISWPVAFAVFYLLAHRHEGTPDHGLAKSLHAGSAWLLGGLVSWEAAWAVDTAVHGGASWRAAGWAIGAILLISLPRLVTRVSWPFRVHRATYLLTVGGGYAIYLGFWSFATNFALRGDADPLPYVPLLNPLDIAQVCVLIAIFRYWSFLRPLYPKAFAQFEPLLPPSCLAGLVFVWANGVLLRTLHQWGGVPFSLESFAQSTVTQTALSIFWAVLSLTTMLFAARKSSRVVWLAGAALLAVVVLKLFSVDLSRVGSIERIVSFVGVGLLMLIIGYLSPLPPAQEQRR